MNEFKTKSGTVLPLISLKGKPYLQVAHRVVWFREEHPDWCIKTYSVEGCKEYSVYKAEIIDCKGRLIATATKREDATHFSDYIEKSETGAIGRALALCGYGTQFCEQDFDELPRIVDSPIQPKKKTVENYQNTPLPVSSVRPHGDHKITEGSNQDRRVKDLSRLEAEAYVAAVRAKLMRGPIDKNINDDLEKVKAHWGIE